MSGGASARQGDLFGDPAAVRLELGPDLHPELELDRGQLQRWQEALAAFQHPLFAGLDPGGHQGELFSAAPACGDLAATINPLRLRAQTLHFWRWPAAPQRGAALYFVVDTPPGGQPPLLLYVGETGRADQRWKGEHDCKRYLSAYSEAIGRAGLHCQLSIRFWLDVPEDTGSRRRLEQALISRWQPPFNKETRQRWATPFTAEPG